MADETRPPEGLLPPEPDTPAASVAPARVDRHGRLGAWVLVALCAAFVAVQWAGLVLRDRLERRTPVLAHAPPAEPGAHAEAAGAAPAGEEPSRFGPDVREVTVAGPGPEEVSVPAVVPAVPAPTATPAAPRPGAPAKAAAPAGPPPGPVKPPPAAAVAKPALPPPTPAPAAPAKAPGPAAKPAAPAAVATHALLVDVFLSQRYLREAEAKLASLGVPHLRSEISRKGRGYRVSVATADEAGRRAARKVLDKGGFVYRAIASGLEVFVYYRDEAQEVADSLAKAGVQAAVEPVNGERPFWRLFAGPFPEAEARRVRKLLGAQGIRTSLEARP